MRTLARRQLLGLAATLVAIAVLGCQGSGDSDGADTARQISDDELARMALALEDFGADFAGFQADGDNGLRTLDQIAEDDLDPEDERADLDRFGWASGYQEFYFDPQASQERTGVLAVGSSVFLFEAVQGATGYLEDSTDELVTQVGKSSKGTTLEEIREFDVDVGDGAAGAVFHGRVESEQGSTFSLWLTAVMFRHGRLIATIDIYSFDEKQFQDTFKDLARQMDQRVGSVLSGER